MEQDCIEIATITHRHHNLSTIEVVYKIRIHSNTVPEEHVIGVEVIWKGNGFTRLIIQTVHFNSDLIQ